MSAKNEGNHKYQINYTNQSCLLCSQDMKQFSIFFLVTTFYSSFTGISYSESAFIEEEIGAWHFHTFFYEVKQSSLHEALNLR